MRDKQELNVGVALPYGIVDPDYARVFTKARCVAWQEGYALMLHGSFTRDLDLLAVPWAEKCCTADHLVKRICSRALLQLLPNTATKKLHGRVAYTAMFKAFDDPRFVDISVMPSIDSAMKEVK